MKFYNSIGPNPRLVRIFAAEKGIELDLIPVDLMSGENRQAPYLEKNPGGQLPCVELDDGTIIAETIVICEYLEEVQATPSLIGTTPEERAVTRMWTRRVGQKIVDPMTAAFRAAEGLPLFKDRMRVFPQAADDLKLDAAEGLTWLNEQMGGREYVAGDQFSLADIELFAFLEFGTSVGQGPDASLENIAKWYARIEQRPSIEASK